MNDFSQRKAVSLGVKSRFSHGERPFLYQREAVSLGVVLYSQGGNISFPGWEYCVPKVGMHRHTLASIREHFFRPMQLIFAKCFISPIHFSESL
jgi:hypothetical protein